MEKTFLGNVPIMLRSDHCLLQGFAASELEFLHECPLDNGGYFIINGIQTSNTARKHENETEAEFCIWCPPPSHTQARKRS